MGGEFNILKEVQLVDHDESEGMLIELSFFMDSGVELFTALKEFSGENEQLLEEIIVDGDFTKLDKN